MAARRILGFSSGPPIVPSAYNNILQVLQTPDYVVIFTEMIHEARIVPLDDRPHLPGTIRQWLGDSRGRWEGDTLVIETTGFSEKASFSGTLMAKGASGKTYRVVAGDAGVWIHGRGPNMVDPPLDREDPDDTHQPSGLRVCLS
ncbi:MAG: hypothetical protein VYE68_16140 [Acidobacteriota bacterium]|nr:hypothetical protein [Acidobacteriota bacterium]